MVFLVGRLELKVRPLITWRHTGDCSLGESFCTRCLDHTSSTWVIRVTAHSTSRNSTSRTCRATGVGAGSKGQGFMAAFPIIKEKWSWVKVLKFGNSAHSCASGSTQSAHVPMLSAEASSSPSIIVVHRLFVLLFLLWFYPGSGATPLYNPYRYMCRPKG